MHPKPPHGVPVKLSILTDKIFDQFFTKEMKTFEQFHMAYLEVCNKFNTIMLGQHYVAPDKEKIEEYFTEWKKESNDQTRKDNLIKHLQEDVKISHTDQSVVTTGILVPPAAMILKKTGEKIPQLKRFRLDFVPDFLFVPVVTLIAVFGVKAANQKNATSQPVSQKAG
ncbi:hypothetical protein Taro_047591 [Colocasia esculenta]|uniref:Uncharacterized protein n=1 Tax=Colocasia esculenta TaxID=4460 RepID=A0A843X796_COLES|nr:hypothetical protein [Colocasia esculenta]